jgi:phosphohistidine swiveling domain-containing protein
MIDQPTIEELLAENPINEHPEPRLYSRSNGGEVAPGVATPLTADLYRSTSGASMCAMFFELGAFTKGERGPAADGSESIAASRFAQFVFGRLSADFDFTLDILGRVPGVDPAAIEEQLTGVPSTRQPPRRTLVRSTRAAAKIVRLTLTIERRIERYAAAERLWWRATTDQMRSADLVAARHAWDDAIAHLCQGQALQCMVAATHPGAVEPVLKMVKKTSSTVDATAVVSGAVTLEATVLERLWDVAHAQGDLASFLGEFGFYGPGAGELSMLSWRQAPAGLDSVLEGYRQLGAAQSPKALMDAQIERSTAAREQFFEMLPALRRPVARALVRRADRMTALRERGKTLMLMGADAARAVAVRIGEHLAAAGAISDALDVFLLTAEEMTTVETDTSMYEVVERRRLIRQAYERLEIPINFDGSQLLAVVRAELEGHATDARQTMATDDMVRGDGVSPGRYAGVARVIRNPGTEMLEPGEVLVCVSTDPGWAPIMSLAGAIVLDLGSMLSHGAIVARELGIPCVANTVSGTARITDGSQVDVDGTTGVVTLLN